MKQNLLSRRDFLAHMQYGLGGVALTSLLSQQNLLAEGSVKFDAAAPFKPRKPHFDAKATNVIVVFCAGAVSHVDFWEYKLELIKQHGKPLPGKREGNGGRIWIRVCGIDGQ